MSKTITLTFQNGVSQSYGYSAAPTVAGDVTTYLTSGPVQNPSAPVTPPVDPPVDPPVTPPVNPPGNVVMGVIANQFKGQPTTITPSQIACFPLPLSDGKYIQTVQAVDTPVSTQVEMWFSTIPGDVNDPLRKQPQYSQWDPGHTNPSYPCVKSYGYQGGPLNWSTKGGAATVGYLPPTPGVTYYVNFRYVGSTPNQPVTMLIQWN